jgi:hypothetical protein
LHLLRRAVPVHAQVIREYLLARALDRIAAS